MKTFINRLLSTIHHDKSLSLTKIPSQDDWGLEDNGDGVIDLDRWDPRQTSESVYKVIALPVARGPATLTPISLQWAILEGGLRPSRIRSIQIPSQEVFEIRGSHLLLVIQCRVRVRCYNWKSKVEDIKKSVLIPADLKVVDLVEAFMVMGNVSGIIEIPESSRRISTTDTRTAKGLGWRHGTELRLDML